jgi:hypothetical protein
MRRAGFAATCHNFFLAATLASLAQGEFTVSFPTSSPSPQSRDSSDPIRDEKALREKLRRYLTVCDEEKSKV